MPEILLVRHAKSYANDRDTAFGNVHSPLNEKGVKQAIGLNEIFRNQFGFTPEDYGLPVLSSHFSRPQQTAEYAGFRQINTSKLIAEAEIPKDMLARDDIVSRHARERWVADEVLARRDKFIEDVRNGTLDYFIYFTHGMFIAAVLLKLYDESTNPQDFPHPFDEDRGFIPNLATITPVNL